jgi:hypothetical protein
MGGRSSSSSSQKSSQTSFSQALYGDNSGVMIGGNDNTVNFTDYGAVEGALNFANNNSENAFLAVMDSNNNMGSVAETGLALADSLGAGAFGLVDSVTGTNAALADSLGFGAFGVASESMNTNAALADSLAAGAFGLTDSAFSLAGDMAGENAELANSAMQINGSLVESSFSLADSLADSFLGAGAGMFGAGAELLNQSGERNLDAALAVQSTGLQQLQMGTDFITALNQQTLDTSLQAQADNNSSLTNGFKSAMQFVEGFSRSDGNAVAETNMKTVGLLSLAAVGVAFAIKKSK